MIVEQFNWFFQLYHQEFRSNNKQAFATVMLLSVSHCFGYYNAKELADYLGIRHQQLYDHLQQLSIYSTKKLLIKYMVKIAAQQLEKVLAKSDSTKSRAGISLSVDNSVIDRFGRMIRCTYNWFSGRWKKVVNGNDLLGIVLTINGMAIPLNLLYCSKQGSKNTDKPSLLLSMLATLKEEFELYDIDITQFSITLDSWFVAQQLKQQLHQLGFKKIIIAGKGNYTFKIGSKKQKASQWKKQVKLKTEQWGIDVPSCRVKANNPTFGDVVLFFFQKSTTRTYYLMDFSEKAHRAAEIWSVWKQHHLVEYFWRMLKSVFKIKAMQLRGNGLYAGLLVKVLAYLFALRLKLLVFSHLTIVQIMRKIRRELDLQHFFNEHFHPYNSVT
jgi:hypothetical protein